MIPIERQEMILELLKKRKSADVKRIAEHCYSSEATVRRDLIELEKMKLIRRTRGGAILFEGSNDEPSASVRMSENMDKKQLIADRAIDLIRDYKTFFFDSSSTVSILARIFSMPYRTVITTGLNSALILSEKKGLNVIIPGGNVSYESNSMVGSLTLRQLLEFNPECAVFSCGGISDGLVTEATFEQSELKKAVASRAKVKVLLADSTKFSRKLPFSVARLDDFDILVTDAPVPKEVLGSSSRIKVIY